MASGARSWEASLIDGDKLRRLVFGMRTLAFRRICALAARVCLIGMLSVASVQAATGQAPIRITDVVGRSVTIEKPARKVVLGAWVSFDALALIHPDPASLLAGWAGEAGANRFQLEPVRRKYPAIDQVPIVGRDTLETLSIETVIALKPDAVVLSRYDSFRLGNASSPSPAFDQLQAAGIPIVIVDFFLDPVRNTERSMHILGQLFGRNEQAEAFIRFYRAHIEAVERRLAKAGTALRNPTVFLHAFAARQDCCWTAGPGTGDTLIRLAGGHSIGADILTAPIGQVNLEYVISRNPDIYVATGGQDVVPGSAFVLGRDIADAVARNGLKTLLARPELAAIGAIMKGRAFGVWHNFSHTPLHLLQVEIFARWFHPELFGDIDPNTTLKEINARFLAVPLSGTFWVSLTN